MKIAILGGSFDPPHLGHYLVIRQLLDYRGDIDKILLVPTYRHQWKPSFASVKDRLAMVDSLVLDKTEISKVEINRKGISYTTDTVREIKKQTGADIYWVVGSDIVSEFHRWENTTQLLSLSTLLVFPRDPFHLPKRLPRGFELVKEKNLITTNISSTLVRQRFKKRKSISYLVPGEVETYIKKHRLYE